MRASLSVVITASPMLRKRDAQHFAALAGPRLRAARRLAEGDDQRAGEQIGQQPDDVVGLVQAQLAARLDEQDVAAQIADASATTAAPTPLTHTAAATAANSVTSGSVLPINGSSSQRSSNAAAIAAIAQAKPIQRLAKR